MLLDKFAVFITTHGRPNHVITYDSLRKRGYTGRIYLICDNEDKTLNEYQRIYKDEVIVFDKKESSLRVDVGDNLSSRAAVVFARNECFRIANNLGIKYFLQVDDDYREFSYSFDSNLKFFQRSIKNLDKVFEAVLEYFSSIDAYCIAFAQRGDFIGGNQSSMARIFAKRKVMNTFFLDADKPFKFLGRMNDDVNSYSVHGHQGKLMFSIMQLGINQEPTQKISGGMSELYKSSGTYQKSFYTVMYCPSFTKISVMGSSEYRIHHETRWNNAVPKIVPESIRKNM